MLTRMDRNRAFCCCKNTIGYEKKKAETRKVDSQHALPKLKVDEL